MFLLGTVAARRASVPVPIPGRKLQAVLALLALSTPRPVSDWRLIDEVWGDESLSDPTNSLQAQISHLRRALGRDVVVRDGGGYALKVDVDDVDALRFERLIDRAQQRALEGDQRSAAQSYRSAISLVQAPPLGELIDFAFARDAAARFEELQLAAHEGLADAELASGRHAEQVLRLTELVRIHPFRERFHAQLIRALYRCGRQSDALRAYSDARRTLIDEVGVEPGPELRDLELAVLSHDPSLAVPQIDGDAPRSNPRDLRPLSDVSGGPHQFQLFGRHDEVDFLTSELDEAIGGRGRVVILAGEPGIGKTRLAEELASAAVLRGVAVAWGRCYSGRGAPAFWPWTQAVGSLVAQLPAEVSVAAFGRGAAAVGQVLPEVHALMPGLSPPPSLDPESERFRLCDALSLALRGFASERPLVIVLDDVHWADASSLQMLAYLADTLNESPLLIVVTYRSVGAPANGALTETMADLARQPMASRLDVVGLDQDAVRALIVASTSTATEEFLGAIYRRTQGNPFFLVESLRLRSSDGALDGLETVPPGVREVTRQRVRLLPDDTVGAIEAASVLGSDFELATLATSLDVDAPGALALLEPAFEAGLLTAGDSTGWDYRFSHVLVRDTLYEGLGVAVRARLHQRAGEALEAVHGPGDGRHLTALAEHWFHAVPAVPPKKGIDYALRSSRWALHHVSHQQAEEQLEAALSLVAGMPEGRERAERELEVHYELSALLMMTTGQASPQVDMSCTRLRELCRSLEDHPLVVPAMWRLSIFYLTTADCDSAVALGEELLELAGEVADPGPLLAGHMALGMIHTLRGELAVATRHLDGALALCRAGHDPAHVGLGSPVLWLTMFSAMNLALRNEGELAEQMAVEAIEIAEAVVDASHDYAVACATFFASVVSTVRGDVLATRRRCEEGIAVATAQGFGMVFVPFMAAHLGWAIAADGDVDGGAAQIVTVVSAIQTSGRQMWRHVVPALLSAAYLVEHRFAQALAHADEGLATLDPGGERWYEAELHRLRGEALRGRDASDPSAAQEFRDAITIAGRQGAIALQRRAEASLAGVGDG